MNIVLHEPEIPFNTGAIGRTCVATNTRLHLIKPYGFILNSKNIKKAGMDYWEHLQLKEHLSYEDFLKDIAEEQNALSSPKIWYATTKAKKPIQKFLFQKMTTLCSERNPPVSRRKFWWKMKSIVSVSPCSRKPVP